MEIDSPHNLEGAADDAHPQDLRVDLSKAEEQAAGLLADLGEVALDSFLKDGLVKDIPVVGTSLSFYTVVELYVMCSSLGNSSIFSRARHA